MNFVTSFVNGKAGGGGNTGTTLEGIVKGDILVINADSSAVLTATNLTVSAVPRIALAYCLVDGYPIISNVIDGTKALSGATNAYVATAYAKKSIGYNATSNASGSLPAVGTTLQNFSGAIVLKTELRIRPNRQDRIDFAVQSLGGYDLAAKTAKDINRGIDTNPKLDGPKPVTAFVRTDISTTIGAFTVAVTKGSKIITFSADPTLVAGAYIQTVAGGTYQIVSKTSATVAVLDYPYAGPTATIGSGLMVKGTPTKWGVEVVANPITKTNPVEQYNQLDFDIALSANYASTPLVVTAYNPGTGNGWQVEGVEIACMGTAGYSDRRDTMRNPYPFTTVISSNYKTTTLNSMPLIQGDFQKLQGSPVGVFIAFDNAAPTQSTAVLAILTPWAASAGVTI